MAVLANFVQHMTLFFSRSLGVVRNVSRIEFLSYDMPMFGNIELGDMGGEG